MLVTESSKTPLRMFLFSRINIADLCSKCAMLEEALDKRENSAYISSKYIHINYVIVDSSDYVKGFNPKKAVLMCCVFEYDYFGSLYAEF